MPLKVITPEASTISIHSPKEFEVVFGIKYLSSIAFSDSRIQEKIENRCAKALHKGWITPRQKWLGCYYATAIHGALALDLTIAWIDERIGYGVWTNRDIPSQTCIGEYTGTLRKRTFFGRWENRYCFDYTMGEGRRSQYVIDAKDFGNHTRFINHSFQPNLEPLSIFCEGIAHIAIFAPKAIPAGTQLCYDYGEAYWQKREKPMNLSR